MRYQARREELQQIAPQYRQASAAQKRTLLDAFVAATGYQPTYARWLLNHAEEGEQTHGRSQLCKYGPDVQHALFLVWHAANRICAKRLIPFLPTLVEALERHEHLHLTEECRRQLLSMSAATADRLLRSQRKGGQRGPSTTRAGTLLKQQIPVRTFEEWSETRPVFLEADLVAHGGVDIGGGYLYILTLTDIATGWTAHYVTRNRTHGSVSPPFSLRMTGPKHRWPKLRVCASGNGRRLFLAVARVRFLMKPPFFLLAVCWCDHVATTPI